MFFYNVKADGFSLDNKREKVTADDLPDCLARWRSRDPQRDTDRTSKAFFVDATEIREARYDLSLNRYKKTANEEEKYDPPKVILERMKKLNNVIARDLNDLEEMLG